MVALRRAPITTVDGHRRGQRSTAMWSSADPAIGLSLTSRYSEWIAEALDELPASFLITDPSIADHPIVFASRGFVTLSGYPAGEVLGRNGRIFQGPATDRRSVMEIREAIREERALQVSLLNYRKDGTPHWILFHLFPVFGAEDGRVVHFVAVQIPIPIPRRPGGSECRGARGMLLGTCRNEVRADADLGCDLAFLSLNDTDNRGLEAEEARSASDWERQKATSVANDILSALTHYSKLNGSLVCRKRCSSGRITPLSSSLTISIGRIKQSFVLTDPHLPDMPIVYASDAFLSLTGYSRHEVLGRNCRFLNGPETDIKVLQQIRDNIRAEQACTIRILNYRKDGSSFWNLLHISPARNATGKVAFFVGVQMEEGSKQDGHGLSPEMRLLGVVGAVKVAVRSLSAGVGPSRSS